MVLMITAAETPDDELVRAAQSGSREDAELLLIRHQPWVFNLAVRMLLRRADAEDATQEVLLKAFKALPTFRGDCQFRTWLYRIAVNHILNIKKAAVAVCSFDDAARGLARVPDLDLPDPRTVPVPIEILVEEAKIGCTMGTLLCLAVAACNVERLRLQRYAGVNQCATGTAADVRSTNSRRSKLPAIRMGIW